MTTAIPIGVRTRSATGWPARPAEYTFTTELIGASQVDAEHFDVLQRLEGNFPGGLVDLHYRFTLRGPAMSELVIEP